MKYLLIFTKARFTAGEVLGEEILGKLDCSWFFWWQCKAIGLLQTVL